MASSWGPGAASCSDQNLASGCIFMPAAGYRHYNDGSLNGEATYIHYWSSSVGNANGGWNLSFDNSGTINPENSSRRGYGFSVRCVAE